MLLLAQGCYLGRGKTVRHVAMAIDGAFVVGGIAIAATPDPEGCLCLVTSAEVGAVPLIVGLAGLLINVLMTPDEPAAKPVPPLEGSPDSVACFGAHRVLGDGLVTLCGTSVDDCEAQRAAAAANSGFTRVSARCEMYRSAHE